MHKTLLSIFVTSLIASACSAHTSGSYEQHEDPLVAAPRDASAPSTGEGNSEDLNCDVVGCPPPPPDWCSGPRSDTSLPAWIVAFWDSTCGEVLPGTCGDGVLTEGELCDDANSVGGDGCSATCDTVEADFVCPAPGQPCHT